MLHSQNQFAAPVVAQKVHPLAVLGLAANGVEFVTANRETLVDGVNLIRRGIERSRAALKARRGRMALRITAAQRRRLEELRSMQSAGYQLIREEARQLNQLTRLERRTQRLIERRRALGSRYQRPGHVYVPEYIRANGTKVPEHFRRIARRGGAIPTNVAIAPKGPSL